MRDSVLLTSCRSVGVCVCLSVCLCLCVCLSVDVSLCLYVCVSIHVSKLHESYRLSGHVRFKKTVF